MPRRADRSTLVRVSVWPQRSPDPRSDLELLAQLGDCIDACVVECTTCAIVHPFNELAADVLSASPRYFRCPLCRGDLADAVRDHIQICRRAPGVTRTP